MDVIVLYFKHILLS